MTQAKVLQVSSDDVTYYTLPGNTGDINFEGNQLDDTVFGAIYSSSETGLINWSVSGNAMYRGQAGYNSIVKRSAATNTAFTGEAMSQVGATKTYRIDDSTKSVWDWNTTPTIYDGGSPVSASNIESYNYLFGEVTFTSGYTVSGAITADGDYFTMSTYGKASSFSLTQSADTTDTTSFEVAQSNGGFNTFRTTLLTADLELSGFYLSSNAQLTDLSNRDEYVIELDLAGDGLSLARGVYKVLSLSQSGDVGGDETYTLSLGLSVPTDVTPFAWQHDSTSGIPDGLLTVQNAWSDRTAIYVRYFPEGEDEYGYKGQVYVTDASISSGVDAMVEATVELQGTGAVTELGTP